MGYKKVIYVNSRMESVEKLEGETIEQKMERVLDNGEPISDGAPEIFTEKAKGVLAAYNIRTDRWEIACEAMDKIQGSYQAKREEKAGGEVEMKVVKDGGESPEGGKVGEA